MSNLAINNQALSGNLSINSMDDLVQMSELMAKSGFFEDCKSAAQAGAKIMAGLEIGVPAFAALSGIHIIKGKAAIGANIMAAKVKGSGKYDYRVTRHDDEACHITFYQGKESIGTSEFTVEDARRMGTQNMGKMPRNMLFARAMSNGVKWYCPDVFLGLPVYTPDELGAQVNEDGEPIQQASKTGPIKIAAVPSSTNPELLQRLEQIEEWTGHFPVDVEAIAAKKGVNPDAMTEADFVKLRNALYMSWGFKQNVFNAPVHASNAFQKMMTEHTYLANGDDADVWMAWHTQILDRQRLEETGGAPVEAEVVA